MHWSFITKCFRYHGLHIGSRSSTRSTSISSSSSALMSCGSFVLFLVAIVVVVVVVVGGGRSLSLFGLALQFTVNFSSPLTSDIEARHRGVEETVVADASTILSAWGVDLIGDVLVESIAESISPEVPMGQGATMLAMRSRLARVGDNRLAFGWGEHVFCRHYGWSLTLRDHKSLRLALFSRLDRGNTLFAIFGHSFVRRDVTSFTRSGVNILYNVL